MVDSTPLGERLDPESLRRVLARGRTLVFLRCGPYQSGSDAQKSPIFAASIDGRSLHQLTQVTH